MIFSSAASQLKSLATTLHTRRQLSATWGESVPEYGQEDLLPFLPLITPIQAMHYVVINILNLDTLFLAITPPILSSSCIEFNRTGGNKGEGSPSCTLCQYHFSHTHTSIKIPGCVTIVKTLDSLTTSTSPPFTCTLLTTPYTCPAFTTSPISP